MAPIPEQPGAAVGVTRRTIIAIGQGHWSPGLETALRRARLFGLGLADASGGEAEVPRPARKPV
ncbi:MAG: transcriptional regulator [Sphingomonadaceae bacterium]